MYKVLIVDDEYIIREGMKTIIDWNANGFEICGEAENGREGLYKVACLCPDLIVLDIKMPVMDGLQMVEELRKQGNDCKVIVLTAYSDFRFAQKFIELGIDSYILKPIEQTDLIEKIQKVYKCIEKTKETQEYIDSSILLSRDKIVEGLAIGNIPDWKTEKYNNLYGFDFPWKRYSVGLIDVDQDLSGEIRLRNDIKCEVEKFVSESNYGYVFYIERYIGVLFKNLVSCSIPRILKGMQDRIGASLGVSVTISMGTAVDGLENIKHSYASANQLMSNKFIYGHKKIIFSPCFDIEDEACCSNEPEQDDGCMLENLYKAVDVNNTVKINDLLQVLKSRFLKYEYEEELIKINYTDLYLTIITRLSEGNDALKHFTDEKKDVLCEIYKMSSLQELHGYIKYKLVTFSDELSSIRPDNPIKRLLDFIDRNYDRDIKLESLSSLFNYNSTYLGKLIKCQTGQCFNTYLDLVRIEKAKMLLKEGLKVYQVVERMGVWDIDYFYKKFKKYTGVSPSNFKIKT